LKLPAMTSDANNNCDAITMSKVNSPFNSIEKKVSHLGEVSRHSLDTRAANQLRDAILTGVFQPGERLTEELIAASFQLSRGTIRASLRLLIHEGLINKEPYRGYSVRSLTSKNAWELFTLRNALEAFASRLLAESISDEKIKTLQSAYQRVVAATKSASRSRAVEADFELHQTIARLTNHSTLQAHYAMIAGQVRLYQTLVSKFMSIDDYIVLHKPLIEAICQGRAQEAERLAAAHNTEDGERLVELLRQAEQNHDSQVALK
jgi:DNA-binding GntR family transcriptional regulator